MLFEVHFGSTSGSSALFVGRSRIAIELLIPDSASEKAFPRERVWYAWVEFDVE